MSHICVLICRVDDPSSHQMTELAAFDLPTQDPTTLQPETALDDLETATHETGNAILRRVLQAHWEMLDAQLTALYRQQCSPEPITLDGYGPISVASRLRQNSVTGKQLMMCPDSLGLPDPPTMRPSTRPSVPSSGRGTPGAPSIHSG